MIKYIVFWVALRIIIVPCTTNDQYNPYSVGPPPHYNACPYIVKDSFLLQFEDKAKLDSFLRNGILRKDIDTMMVQIDTAGLSKFETGKIYFLNNRNK